MKQNENYKCTYCMITLKVHRDIVQHKAKKHKQKIIRKHVIVEDLGMQNNRN